MEGERVVKNEQELQKHLEQLLAERKNQSFRPKRLEEFRNHYKNFQYDYEEDLYEPVYEDEE